MSATVRVTALTRQGRPYGATFDHHLASLDRFVRFVGGVVELDADDPAVVCYRGAASFDVVGADEP